MPASATSCKPRPDACPRVQDSRKRRVRGVWMRRRRFYANLTLSDELGRTSSRFVALKGVNLEDAIKDYRRLRAERAGGRKASFDFHGLQA